MPDIPLLIEPETPADAEAIERLNERVFGPGRFARTAYRLREEAAADPALSFVARVGTMLVGANRMTPILIGDTPALLLGPLTVEPAFRSQGIGERLVSRSLDAARSAGATIAILVGDEPYYARMGFRRTPPGACACRGRSIRRAFFIVRSSPAPSRASAAWWSAGGDGARRAPVSADDASPPKSLDLAFRLTEFGQDRRGVFAKPRRGDRRRHREPIEHDWRAHRGNRSARRAAGGQIDPHAARRDLRIGEHLGDRIDRPRRHGRLFERGEQRRAGELLGRLLDRRDKHRAIGDAVGVGAKPRIVGERLQPEDAAEVARLPVIAGGDDDLAVGDAKHLIGHDIGMGVAEPSRRACPRPDS